MTAAENALHQDVWSLPLEDIDPAQPDLFQDNSILSWFERLRREDPVHFTDHHEFGRYWSVTRYEDIMYVDTHHELFSSEPSITLRDQPEDFTLPMFIAMDEPRHSKQRGEVNPVVGSRNLPNFAELIRTRTQEVLDKLPVGETFDWVEEVSIELTTRMLATLFDFPYEERRRLTRWSDVATALPGGDFIETEEQRREELIECLETFTGLWNEKAKLPPQHDMVSMLAHGENTRNMQPLEYLGNLLLLIVGGNDTTRNSMSGSVLALHENPEEFAKLKANPRLIPSMVSETIRWQTPLAFMRRTALEDTELGGKTILKGDKVAMWYVSGNRDDSVFEQPEEYIIDRPNVRKHLSFGYGIHRCMGSHLAELQLKILWEEILERFERIEVVGDVRRSHSVFVRGYTDLPVVVHPKQG